MNLSLKSSGLKDAHIVISGSKSESNRLLILSSLFKNLSLKNISNSDDTNHLIKALRSKSSTIDIGHAGTAMRFLTSYFSLTTKKEIELRGSQRMHNRPIKILVDSLRKIGASIHYLENIQIGKRIRDIIQLKNGNIVLLTDINELEESEKKDNADIILISNSES